MYHRGEQGARSERNAARMDTRTAAQGLLGNAQRLLSNNNFLRQIISAWHLVMKTPRSGTWALADERRKVSSKKAERGEDDAHATIMRKTEMASPLTSTVSCASASIVRRNLPREQG